VNYYEHHIGDYAEATAHLSFVEDAAYSRLIRKYYSTEKPLPCNVAAVARLVAARTDDERSAVESVLNEFFELREDGWHNARCDEEIARFQAGEPEREIRRTNEQERLRRHREERAQLFQALHAAQLFPAWNIPISQLRELHAKHCKPATDSPPLQATAPATPATATQTPVPNTQTPNLSKKPPTPLKGANAHTRSEREIRKGGLDAWERTCKVIDAIRKNPNGLTWADADKTLNDPLAAEAIKAAGGHRAISERTQYTQGDLKRRFREHYESQLEKGKEKEGPNGHATDESPRNAELHGLMSEAAKGMAQ
jgi:uncharacterized protein YdaU (DUF1376 family)